MRNVVDGEGDDLLLGADEVEDVGAVAGHAVQEPSGLEVDG
jgi:hypothetical protein